jgi:hypothetical protein
MTSDISLELYDVLREKNLLELEIALRTSGVPNDQMENMLEFCREQWAENRARYIQFARNASGEARAMVERDGATIQ